MLDVGEILISLPNYNKDHVHEKLGLSHSEGLCDNKHCNERPQY